MATPQPCPNPKCHRPMAQHCKRLCSWQICPNPNCPVQYVDVVTGRQTERHGQASAPDA